MLVRTVDVVHVLVVIIHDVVNHLQLRDNSPLLVIPMLLLHSNLLNFVMHIIKEAEHQCPMFPVVCTSINKIDVLVWQFPICVLLEVGTLLLLFFQPKSSSPLPAL